ncbi:coiled-coil domain-containing protein 43 isoform X2 [Protobothrops mucrosquamatus]|uniref:coiled-coil domain-containing protein 43 isoform X2 n=1 Tax=Protobothrops mucrosquamatus TaxID=103944 RepID=UPI000775F974|nr:coiled-coil domain-containing protein 43 isoform X2 [Protobothrops mucrosquamatus]
MGLGKSLVFLSNILILYITSRRFYSSVHDFVKIVLSVLKSLNDEDVLQEVCKEIIEKWSEAQDVEISEKKEDEIQAITNIIEKQAQIVVKPKEVLKEDTLQKAALLAQYAEVTDDEDEVNVHEDLGAAAMPIASNKSLFKNTNLEDVMNARKLEREHLRDESQRKKERDKFQREKDKLTKQERKEKEKKRTQKGEKKR